MTRLFVAAWPPCDVADRLARFAAVADEGSRPVPADRLHVTLRFIGDVDADTVAERLRVADLPASDARFGPEVVRLGGRQVVVPVKGADELATAVCTATHGLGLADRREFFGHITLARTRRGARSTIEGRQLSGSFPLDDIRLVGSALEPTGPVYTTLGRFPAG